MSTVSGPEFREMVWPALTGRLGDGPSLRIGSGATVPVSYAQSKARDLFADALFRLAPQVSYDLVTATGLELMDATHKAFVDTPKRWDMDSVMAWKQEVEELLEAAPQTLEALRRMMPKERQEPDSFDAWRREVTKASEALDRHIGDWQSMYHLQDDWIGEAAYATLMIVLVARPKGNTDAGPLLLGEARINEHDGKANRDYWDPETRHFTQWPDHSRIDVPVFLDDLMHSPTATESGEWEDVGEIGTFDPRTETVSNAAKRLMPEIERRLRRALETIEADDRSLNGAVAPVTYRSVKAFERLVRFQVLGESRKKIAKADGVERQNIGPQIKETARLIGLTLRDDKGDPE